MKLNLCAPWRKHRSPNSPWQVMSNGSLREFKYEELHKATEGFSEDMGSGYFCLYRGMLPDSTLVAVKILSHAKIDGIGAKWQIMSFSGLDISLLPLIGLCFESDFLMLVYEYMPRRSLDLHLFQQPKEEYSHQLVLDWNRRYQIALGTARGLAKLYFGHGNIKPENIILDSHFCPKLTDFYGWFDCELDTKNHWILSISKRTTRSYIAPELLRSPERFPMLNHKSDVYSYGMVLFEIISGIRNSENGETPNSFPTRVASVITSAGGHDILSVLDKRLAGNADEEEVLRVCKVACWCIHHDPRHRPFMEQVVYVLEGVVDDKHCEIAFN